MALTIAEILRAVNPNIGLVVNPDGSYRIGVEDINSDEILAVLVAMGVDLAAIEIINTAIQAAVEAILLDTADIETATEAINTALQAGGISQLQFATMVTALGNIQTAVQIIDDWDEANRAKVNPVVGQAGIAANAGAMDALTTRVTLATDDTHMGAVGTAAAVAGVLHAQQRYIGEQLALILAAVAAGGVGVYTTPTHTQPVIGAGTTVALAANANRLYVCLVNDGTEPIYVKLGVNAVMNQGIRLNVGGSYEMSRELGNLYVGAINGICASGGMTLLVTEGV